MKLPSNSSRSSAQQGFSLMETMVGAVILFTLLYSTNRTIALGMNNSRQAGSRAYLEADVLNDMERIRRRDDELNRPENIKTSCKRGSSNGALYLMQWIKQQDPDPNSTDLRRHFDSSDPQMLQVIYTFVPPESARGASSESRILEIHPSFLAQCS